MQNPTIDFAQLEKQAEIDQARKIKPYRGKTIGEFGDKLSDIINIKKGGKN